MRQHRQHPVTVLNYGTRQQDAKWDGMLSVQCDEYQVRAGFRDQADQAGHQEEEPGALLRRPTEHEEPLDGSAENQGTERPQEDPRRMFPRNMHPDVLFEEMVRHGDHNEQRSSGDPDQADPDLVPRRRPDLAAGDRGGEHCQRCGQDTARGGTFFPLRKYFRGGKPQGLLCRMNDKSLAAGPETGSLSRDEVDRNASKDRKNEQNCHERESRFRNERPHHKRLIPTRRDHRCDYRTERDGAMGIERDDGERAKTARRCPEERRQQVLTDSTARPTALPGLFRAAYRRIGRPLRGVGNSIRQTIRPCCAGNSRTQERKA
jgi:hypothetical protein